MNSPMDEEFHINLFPHRSKPLEGAAPVLWLNNNRRLWMTHLGLTITDIHLVHQSLPKLAAVSPGAFQNQSTLPTFETSQSGIQFFVFRVWDPSKRRAPTEGNDME